MKLFYVLVGLSFFWLAGLAGAETIAYPTPVPTLTPDQVTEFKETHLIYSERDIFGTHFYLNGREIEEDRELKSIIASVQDEDATQYWKASEDKSNWGWVLVAGGSGMAVAGGVLSWQGNSNATLDNILVLGGLCADVLGGLLWREAQFDQLAAVDRYNAIVKEDNGISLLDLKDRGTGLAWVSRF